MSDMLADLAKALMQRGWLMATAESCTGGLIAATCTDCPGASQWFDAAVVSYSYEAKQAWLGVPRELIEQEGAVSEAVVKAMATGMLSRSQAHVAVAVSGVAGPGGGTSEKPVGTVWVAWAVRGQLATAKRYQFVGDRQAVRQQTCDEALKGLVTLAMHNAPF